MDRLRDLNSLKIIGTISTFFVLICVLLSISSYARAADEDNCLMCHKYRFLGRIDENGNRINYNVDPRIFNDTVHRTIACRECHNYIKKIPHDPVTEQVNCGTLCHVITPFSKERFSHQHIIEIYNSSVHAPKPDDSPKQKEAKPGCKFCHLNPIYSLPKHDIPYDVSLRRCLNCHQQKGVTQAYKHITHRIRRKTSRSSQEIVALCAKCHADKELMERFKVSQEALTAVETYKRSIHGESVTLGSQETADCISCHASNKLHDIYKKDDRRATIFSKNINKTCQQCHEQTNRWFVEIAVHPRSEGAGNPIVYFISISLRFALYGTVFGLVGLMLLETYGRKRKGIKFLLRHGTSWRGKATPEKSKQKHTEKQ
jgi:hypothetical protein